MKEITKRAQHISDAKFYANELLKANNLDARFEARTTAPKKEIFAEEISLFDKTNNQRVQTLGRAKNAEEAIEAFVKLLTTRFEKEYEELQKVEAYARTLNLNNYEAKMLNPTSRLCQVNRRWRKIYDAIDKDLLEARKREEYKEYAKADFQETSYCRRLSDYEFTDVLA